MNFSVACVPSLSWQMIVVFHKEIRMAMPPNKSQKGGVSAPEGKR